VAIVAFVKIRAVLRVRTDGTSEPVDRSAHSERARSADDIIAEARAQGRRELGLDEPGHVPTDPDDIIAEARRRARAEVDALDDPTHDS
jgi:hypothetical protein